MGIIGTPKKEDNDTGKFTLNLVLPMKLRVLQLIKICPALKIRLTYF